MKNKFIDKNTLKVTATSKELDYKGEVKTVKLTKEIPFNFDSKNFIKYAIRNFKSQNGRM